MNSVWDESPFGYEITDIRKQSFILNGELISEINVLYLKFSNLKWYEINISDGISSMNSCEEPSEIFALDEFQYPITTYESFNRNCGKLVSIEEYLWLGIESESCGIALHFDTCSILVFDEEENIVITFDFENNVKREWVKVPVRNLLTI